MAVYGNSLQQKSVDVEIGRTPIFGRIQEKYPSGAYIAPADLKTEALPDPVGTVIPAGTPVAIDTVGGKATLNAAKPIGLTYQDATIGENGATIDIVTRGEVFESRLQATLTAAQKTALAGRILFIAES